MLKDKRGCLGLRIAYHIEELNNVGAAAHVLQNFDFSFDFLLFDGLEYLDDTLGVVDDVDAFKDFRVLAAANFANDFVLFLVAPVDRQSFVIPVIARAMDIDVGVYSVGLELEF